MPQSSSSDGNYVVVARRYRPLGFDELVGQEHVGRALRNAIETNRVGHAYLFTGARGVGKTSTARIFAKALNDPSGPTASPDNASDVAQAIDSGEDVDVIEIDGASNRGIDEIRSLRANVGVRPSRSRYKIYIIDEVHMLTGAAFNALLKTLEEPPEHVKFIFCTTDPEKIPITVLSRCQRFDFAPVEVSKIIGRLREIVTAEGQTADDLALELIARRAAGSMRDSQSLLEQVLSFSDGSLTAAQVHQMLGTADDERLHKLATAMADRDSAAAMRLLDEAIDEGVDAGRLSEQLLGYFRDLMAVTVGCDASLLRHTSAGLFDELKALGDRWGLQTVLAVVGLIDQTLVRIRLSVYSRVLLEATLIQICSLPDLQAIADLAAASGTALAPAGQSSRAAAVGEKKKRSLNPSRPVAEPVTEPVAEPVAEPAASEVAPVQSVVSSQPDSDAATAVRSVGAVSKAVTEAVVQTVAPPTAESEHEPLSASNVQPIWDRAIATLDEMRQTMAASVSRIERTGDRTLRLVFPAESMLTMRRWEAADNRAALTDALVGVTGHPVVLEMVSDKPVAPVKKAEPTAPKTSRMQRMREIESNSLVKSCVDVFGAEIVRIDRPK